KNEKIRLNEVGPGEIENPELREIINKSVRGINELQTQFERFRDGKISIAEVKKLCRKTDKKIREIRLMLKEYEERKA
ncbi:MAG: hypothetical protein KKD92_12040, partial [Proteobacteria bacterium]|nr:hypothetical protein [Pseudomonadota bacterium]